MLPISAVYRVPNPIPISAVLISRDAEANIADTLEALADFPEVVVYDNGSEDAETALSTPSEGQEMQVLYKGSVVPILGRICGHLRSGISYAGESSLADARGKIVSDVLSYFVRLSEASRAESFER